MQVFRDFCHYSVVVLLLDPLPVLNKTLEQPYTPTPGVSSLSDAQNSQSNTQSFETNTESPNTSVSDDHSESEEVRRTSDPNHKSKALNVQFLRVTQWAKWFTSYSEDVTETDTVQVTVEEQSSTPIIKQIGSRIPLTTSLNLIFRSKCLMPVIGNQLNHTTSTQKSWMT
jgi:hypothetical protein